MKFIKKYLKLFIGNCVLVMVVLVFFFAKRGETLEIGTLKDWRAAPMDRRVASVQILMASEDNNDILVACIDKISTLPDSSEMAVRDAISLCQTGLRLQQNM